MEQEQQQITKTNDFPSDDHDYLSGFGNTYESESIPGSLPSVDENSPLLLPLRSLRSNRSPAPSFTSPSQTQQRRLVYMRIKGQFGHSPQPFQARWKAKSAEIRVEESAPIDFVEGLYTVCGAGSSFLRHGFAIHMYTANKSWMIVLFAMRCDFLICSHKKERGLVGVEELWITTWNGGKLQVSPPGEWLLYQPFQLILILEPYRYSDISFVALSDDKVWKFISNRRYFAESNRHLMSLVTFKICSLPSMWLLGMVINVPYRVLNCTQLDINSGVALLEFCLFSSSEWLVAEVHTFRPHHYHAQLYEVQFMGLIYGGYEDAGASSFSCMISNMVLIQKTYENTCDRGQNALATCERGHDAGNSSKITNTLVHGIRIDV
ncbi:LOW QUALITY PROTEIN: homogentisate 1,2-dioxygenase [Populus alba]|uniref:LOW QUALITY PROTEIN: homogentisate 1,2-dioxygenase n=1 Tax=Populus alba TaxID=43335 RepID=UPI003CC714C4